MERAAQGRSRRKPVGDGVPIDTWAQCLSGHVQECIDAGIAPFPIDSHVHIGKGHGACMQSVLSMLHLLKMMFTMAQEGHCQLHKALLSAGVLGREAATVEPSKQGCRPVGRCSCTGNQVCDGALQAHGAATQEV